MSLEKRAQKVAFTAGEAISREYGPRGHSAGSYEPHCLKSMIFVAYAIASAGPLAIPALRRKSASRVLLGLIGVYFLLLYVLGRHQGSLLFVYLVYQFTPAVWCLSAGAGSTQSGTVTSRGTAEKRTAHPTWRIYSI
jgi:hypothetical protein